MLPEHGQITIPAVKNEPLAIGDIKYKTQAALFRSMLASRETVMLDFTHAFAKARKLVCARPANP